MKTWDRALLFWGAGALLAEALLGWALFAIALKVTRQVPVGFLVWFFPLILFPILLALVVFLFLGAKSRSQRMLIGKYLTLYLPWVAGPIAVQLYGDWPWDLVACLIALPGQIGIPFWYSRKMKLLQIQEHEAAAV